MTLRYLLKVPEYEVAYVYNFLHTEEGMASFRTVATSPAGGSIIEVEVPPPFTQDFQALLDDIRAYGIAVEIQL